MNFLNLDLFFEKKRYNILFALILSLLVPQLFTLTSSLKLNVLIILLLPTITLLIWRFDFSLIILLASTFTMTGLLNNYLSVSVSFILFSSFILTFKNNSSLNKKRNPILIPFIIWVLSVIPSIYNVSVFQELGNFINTGVMATTAALIYIYVTNYELPKKVFLAYLGITFLNGLSVIYQSHISGGARVFGFAGICYIDFVNIAIISLLCFLIFVPSKQKKYLIALILFYFFTLLLTQTRNSFLSLAAALSSIFLIVFKYNKKFNFSRMIVIKNSLIVMVCTIVIFIGLLIIFPSVADRFLELVGKGPKEQITSTSLVNSSLVSRMLIWHTSLNAFLKHPFAGIGLFSFSHQSQLYHTIPNFLYKEFVWHLTPHETFIAMLAETGIIGFTGFLILIMSILFMCFKTFKLAKNQNEILISFILLSLQLYILFSMFLTDAWLWGQCGMQWAIITGFSMANYKLISNKNYGIK